MVVVKQLHNNQLLYSIFTYNPMTQHFILFHSTQTLLTVPGFDSPLEGYEKAIDLHSSETN